jgi:putative peptidoglycan lipid II flippase
MVSNVALSAALYPVLGYRGVALGTSLAAGVNYAVLAWAWRRREGTLGGKGILVQLGKVLVASAVLGAVAWGAQRGLAAALPASKTVPRQLALALLPIAAGGLAYVAAAKALRIAELDEFLAVVRRRRARRPATKA